MIRQFLSILTITVAILAIFSMVLAFLPIHTPHQIHPSGVNKLAAQAFLNSVLLIFSSLHVASAESANLSYNKFRSTRVTAPLASIALLIGTGLALWKSFEVLMKSEIIFSFKNTSVIDLISPVLLLFSAMLLLVVSIAGSVLTYQSRKTWQTLYKMRKS